MYNGALALVMKAKDGGREMWMRVVVIEWVDLVVWRGRLKRGGMNGNFGNVTDSFHSLERERSRDYVKLLHGFFCSIVFIYF